MEHPSIRSLLQQQLLKAWIDAFSPTPPPFPAYIPVYRLKQNSKIVYRCSAALQLTSQLQLSPEAITQQLLTHLAACRPSQQQPSLEFTLELREKGMMDCYLCDRSLILWLEQFPQMFLSFFHSLEEEPENPHLNLFPLQYTHARCCSLLRLADLDGLIEFNPQHLEQPRGLWNAPNRIPWFRLNEITEYSLMGQILHIIDDLEKVAPNHTITLAHQLCDAFWQFERYCRIWGKIKQENRDLAQARLGLVALTQLILWWLLQEKFKVTALREL